MSTAVCGVKRKQPPSSVEERVQPLNIENFESVLEEYEEQRNGTSYYPICLGYRIMQDCGIDVTCSKFEQERMSRFSRRFFISRDAKMFSKQVTRTKIKYKDIDFGKAKQGNYLRRTLHCNGKTWGAQLHRLMLLTFKPIVRPELFQVDHIIKSNQTHRSHTFGDQCNSDSKIYSNHLEHLQWLTPKENSQRKNCKKHKKRVIGLKPVTAIHIASGGRYDFKSVADACKELQNHHPGLEFNCGTVSANCYGRCNPIHGYKFVFQDASIEGEVWKPIPNSKWHVSDHGRVKGTYGQIHKGHPSNNARTGLEYRRVHITHIVPVKVINRVTKVVKMKRKRKYQIHNFVYQAFKGPLEDGMVVDHYDGFGHHNCASNLRLISQSENAKHRGRSECASGQMEPVCKCGFVRKV